MFSMVSSQKREHKKPDVLVDLVEMVSVYYSKVCCRWGQDERRVTTAVYAVSV